MSIKDKSPDEQRAAVEEMMEEMKSRNLPADKARICKMISLNAAELYPDEYGGFVEKSEEEPKKDEKKEAPSLQDRMRAESEARGDMPAPDPDKEEAESAAQPQVQPEPVEQTEQPAASEPAKPAAPIPTGALSQEEALEELKQGMEKLQQQHAQEKQGGTEEPPAEAKREESDPKVPDVEELPNEDFMGMLENLSEIDVSESPDGKLRVMSDLRNRAPSQTTSVVCVGSGYTASMAPLTMQDKSALKSVKNTALAVHEKLYQLIYNRIEECSPPKPTYKNWLEMTAIMDVDTLLFGLYASSYRGSHRYPVNCGECGHTNQVEATPAQLVKTFDEETRDTVREIRLQVGHLRRFEDLLHRGQHAAGSPQVGGAGRRCCDGQPGAASGGAQERAARGHDGRVPVHDLREEGVRAGQGHVQTQGIAGVPAVRPARGHADHTGHRHSGRRGRGQPPRLDRRAGREAFDPLPASGVHLRRNRLREQHRSRGGGLPRQPFYPRGQTVEQSFKEFQAENDWIVWMLDVFDGQLSYTEIIQMDQPRMTDLVRARQRYVEEQNKRQLAEQKAAEELAK